MPEAEYALRQRLQSTDGSTWVVINVHPPQGRRMRFSYTLLREADSFAFLLDPNDIEELGLTLIQAE